MNKQVLYHLKQYFMSRDIILLTDITYPTADPIVNRLYEAAKCVDNELYLQAIFTLLSIIDAKGKSKHTGNLFRNFFSDDRFISALECVITQYDGIVIDKSVDIYKKYKKSIADVFYNSCRNKIIHEAIFSDKKKVYIEDEKRDQGTYADNEIFGRFEFDGCIYDSLFVDVSDSGSFGHNHNIKRTVYVGEYIGNLTLRLSYKEFVELLARTLISQLYEYSETDYNKLCEKMETDIELCGQPRHG